MNWFKCNFRLTLSTTNSLKSSVDHASPHHPFPSTHKKLSFSLTHNSLTHNISVVYRKLFLMVRFFFSWAFVVHYYWPFYFYLVVCPYVALIYSYSRSPFVMLLVKKKFSQLSIKVDVSYFFVKILVTKKHLIFNFLVFILFHDIELRYFRLI